jgi:transmembrane sensor
MTAPEPPIPDPLFREAAGWFARNRGPEAEASREDFEGWLRTSALHRRAYARAAEVFALGKLLADEEPTTPAPPPGRRGGLLIGGAAALAAAAAALFLLLGPSAAPRSPPQGVALSAAAPILVASAPDRERTVLLPDGSAVRLRRASAVEVRLGPDARRVELLRGAARFRVRHEARPFTVHAAGGVVTARGTLFDVSMAANGAVTVRLIEGAVDVVSGDRRGGEVAHLRAGQALHYAGVAHPAAPPARGPPASAPSNEAREYESVRLGALIGEANRAGRRQIRVEPPALAERRISGRFRTDDPLLLADRLAGLLDLEVAGDSSGAIVLRRR